VLNCWVTATNDTPRASNISTIFAKSASRASEPIDLVDHHYIDETLADICEQPL